MECPVCYVCNQVRTLYLCMQWQTLTLQLYFSDEHLSSLYPCREGRHGARRLTAVTHTHTTCDFLAAVTPSLSVYCLSSLCLKISETFYANCNKGDGKVPILNPCRPNWLYHMAHDVWEAIIGPNTQRGGVLTPEPSGCPLTKRPNMLAWSSSKPTHATILSLYQCYL